MISKTTATLWRQITATAIGTSAIAVGALAFASSAQAETFEYSCTTNPGAYAANATIGAYHVERRGADRDQVCKVYNDAYKLLGTMTKTDYGYYSVPKNVIGLPTTAQASQISQ
jgi:hypothetical protein